MVIVPIHAGVSLGDAPVAGEVAKLNVRVFRDEGTETEEVVSKDVGSKEVLSKVTSDGPGVEASFPSFLLSEGLLPVPPKLVKKFRQGIMWT